VANTPAASCTWWGWWCLDIIVVDVVGRVAAALRGVTPSRRMERTPPTVIKSNARSVATNRRRICEVVVSVTPSSYDVLPPQREQPGYFFFDFFPS
jgi:hypothetical protein